jgi:hypothetical protein
VNAKHYLARNDAGPLGSFAMLHTCGGLAKSVVDDGREASFIDCQVGSQVSLGRVVCESGRRAASESGRRAGSESGSVRRVIAYSLPPTYSIAI